MLFLFALSFLNEIFESPVIYFKQFFYFLSDYCSFDDLMNKF